MAIADDIYAEVLEIFKSSWTKTDGRVVPDTDDVKLGNDAVLLKGTVLYADMADSTGLVNSYKDHFAAEVYKTYLKSACRVITHNGGVITAFDGDRVMAVFIGETKNSDAAKTALQINHTVQNIINKALKEAYQNSSFQIKQAVGIDTSDLFVARTGIRGSNDLVWIGRASNYAAKLCNIREDGFYSYITEDVFNQLMDSSKYGGDPKRAMWEKRSWNELGLTVYRSNWTWSI
jgi:class 3 adenylate cyclase